MKQKKRLKIYLIIMIVIFITVIEGIGVFAATDAQAKLELINAIVKTREKIEDTRKLSNENSFIDRSYIQDLCSGAIHSKGNVTFKGIDEFESFNPFKDTFTFRDNNEIQDNNKLEKYNFLKGAGLDFDISYDVPNKKILSKSSLKFLGLSLIDYNFYTDNEKLMFNVPQVYDNWISMEAKNIQEQYNNSVFAQDEKVSEDEEISFELFGENGLKYMDNYKLAYQIKDELKKIKIEKLFENYQDISVKKLEEKKNIYTDNGYIPSTGYSVNIPKNVINEIINNITDSLKNNKELNNSITKYITGNQYYDIDALEDYYEILDAFKIIVEYMSSEDVNGVFYVSDEGIIVDFNLKTTIHDYEENMMETIDVIVSGKVEEINGLECNQTLKAELISQESDDKVAVEFKTQNSTTDFNSFGLYLEASGEVIEDVNLGIAVGSFFNTINESTILSMVIENNDYTVGLVLDGYITIEDENKSIDFNFDNSSIVLYPPTGEQKTISFSYKNKIEPLTSEVEEPSGEKVEIFKCSEEEIEDIIQSVSNKASFIYETLEKLIVNQ